MFAQMDLNRLIASVFHVLGRPRCQRVAATITDNASANAAPNDAPITTKRFHKTKVCLCSVVDTLAADSIGIAPDDTCGLRKVYHRSFTENSCKAQSTVITQENQTLARNGALLRPVGAAHALSP